MIRTQLRRDPFARTTLIRFTIPAEMRIGDCAWCGSRPGRFRYATEGDGWKLLPCTINALQDFCSIGCWEAYSS